MNSRDGWWKTLEMRRWHYFVTSPDGSLVSCCKKHKLPFGNAHGRWRPPVFRQCKECHRCVINAKRIIEFASKIGGNDAKCD